MATTRMKRAKTIVRNSLRDFVKRQVVAEAMAISEEGEVPSADLLAKHYALSPRTVREWLTAAGVVIVDGRSKDQVKDRLLADARAAGVNTTANKLAKTHGVNPKTARKWLDEAGIDTDATPGKVPFGYDNHDVRDAILRQCARVFAAGGAGEVHPDLFVTQKASKAAITRWLLEAGYGPFPKEHNAEWVKGYEYHPDSPYIAANKDRY